MTECERLARNVTDVWGEAGTEWLNALPSLLERLSARWAITLCPPFPDLSFNYVAPVSLADGGYAVLKVGVPDRERIAETASLPHYGESMVRLLDADLEAGALLLERLEPGEPLTILIDSGIDDGATLIGAGILRNLWRDAPAGLPVPTVADWAAGLGRMRRLFDGGTGPLPADLVEQAERDFAELTASEPAVLLHGDFHHGNVLSAGRTPWLAIDPKGLIGPRGYDAGNFLRSNLESAADPARVLKRRIDILSTELDLDRESIRRWSIAQGVLSAWWSIEDHGDGWQNAIAAVRLLALM